MASYPYVYPSLEDYLIKHIRDINPRAVDNPERTWVKIMNGWNKPWHCNRWIQIFLSFKDTNIHLEYQAGWVYFHLEHEYAKKKYSRLVRELRNKTIRDYGDEVIWQPSESWKISCYYKDEVKGANEDEQRKDLVRILGRMTKIFDQDVLRIFGGANAIELKDVNYDASVDCVEASIISESFDKGVSIKEQSITDLFKLPLTIPGYQRIYCWENAQIIGLWNSLLEMSPECPYHLGTIIIQKNDEKFEIVDGQQRLVTLSLIVWALGFGAHIPLLGQRFQDPDAIKHIKNAKALIDTLRANLPNNDLLEKIKKQLVFSVIVVNEENLDLAYTFFTNQNSKGVRLSSYDLLKAHHLRYISSEQQARHLAVNWSRLTQVLEGENLQIDNALGILIYRMRHFIRKSDFNETGYYVRDEFMAAPIMADVPPFGERFEYYEPIQGGAHFFAFAQQFNGYYEEFAKLKQVTELRNNFRNWRHRPYEEMAETMLFCYFLKFGKQYLSEALFCILSRLAEHRYQNTRALEEQVQRFAIATDFVQMVQFSTSPTFFLASALQTIKTGIMDYDITGGIRRDFYKRICMVFSALKDVTVSEIKKRIENEY